MPETRFRTALEGVLQGSSQPVMHFQPIVDLRRGCAVGYEALVRFPAPPALPPEDWFRSAQARGKRLQLEAMVTRMALAARPALPQDTFLSINMSPYLLMSDEYPKLLAEQGDLARVVLEITEGDPVHEYCSFMARLEMARDMGGSIAVDDTGAGYASMKHVMELRPQFVKLDRFFVAGCQHDPAKTALIRMIGEAAGNMDAWLIAEGVETESELFELMRHGVPLGQGFLLGRPALAMHPLEHELAVRIRAHAAAAIEEGLRRHLEIVAVVPTIAAAEQVIQNESNRMCAVVVDGYRRPMNLVEVHPLCGLRTLSQPMRVQLASSLQEVLLRAVSRPLRERFDPLVAINERGEFEGLLRVERLMEASLKNPA